MKWWPLAVCLLIVAEPGVAQATQPVGQSVPEIAAPLPADLPQSPPAIQPENATALPEAPAPTAELLAATTEPAAPKFSAAAFPLPLVDTLPEGFAHQQSASQPGALPVIRLEDCPYTKIHYRECRVRWGHTAIEASLWLAFQNAGNIYTSYTYRVETTAGKWWDRYVNSVEGWRWNVWNDNNPFLDAYIAHPISGSITNYIWIQNDPKVQTLVVGKNPVYWWGLLRPMAFSTFYSFQWKLGPIGEASIGHNGDHYYYAHGVYTNETGWVELVTTPVGGTLWTVTEDVLDKYVITRLENHSRNPIMLLGYQFLNPTRGVANMLRFRPPWYRDTRVVRAKSFWDEPGGGASLEDREEDELDPTALAANHRAAEIPVWPHLGGVHEFGAWWGFSPINSSIGNTSTDVKYMPIEVTYSYLLGITNHWQFRYSPEMTAITMIDWPHPGSPNPQQDRIRAYGSGFSPVGFQLSARPYGRVQPFISSNDGFIYFDQRVLAEEGSRLMYTFDAGAGINIMRKDREAITLGYRFQYLTNFGLSAQNPATQANVFYVGASLFRTRHYR